MVAKTAVGKLHRRQELAPCQGREWTYSGSMHRSDSDITYFACTNHRNAGKRFGIRRADRRSHMYAIGKTGTGKSTLLKTLILQDMERGEGLALLDPHGDLVEEVVFQVPPRRRGDLIYLDVPNRTPLSSDAIFYEVGDRVVLRPSWLKA
jgi:hypothetical protein